MKKYPTIGCCGIDCGLCPRYHTDGSSRCPGCFGLDFPRKHPGCPFITCCVKKKGLEVCAECAEFACDRFRGFDATDSFVTHKRSTANLESIRDRGLDEFVKLQGGRMNVLNRMLDEFDDGRSKSYYCLSSALLPLSVLESALDKAAKETKSLEKREKARILRGLLEEAAGNEGVRLALDNKGRY